jgi:acyl-CoA synthetase (AMP-forming)/AMP-acid ligase II
MDKIQPDPDDVDFPVLPIVLMINLGVGCTSVIAPYKSSKPEKMQPERIIDLMKKHSVNRMVASPYFVRRVAEEVIRKKEQLSALKKVFTGGAPVFPNEAAIYLDAFPQCAIEIVFGSTEAEPISSISAIHLKERNITQIGGLPVGFPYHGTSLKIIKLTDENIACETARDLEDFILPTGRIGEIIVSGKHVLREYINNDDALRRNKIFIGETCWHRTGDSGFTDETGGLFLTGRCNSLIEHQGNLIATFIVENQLQLFDEIELGTILKINDKIVAFIELKKGAHTGAELFDRLKELLPFISEVAEVKRMPRDPRHHSRIDYAQLIKLFR